MITIELPGNRLIELDPTMPEDRLNALAASLSTNDAALIAIDLIKATGFIERLSKAKQAQTAPKSRLQMHMERDHADGSPCPTALFGFIK